VMSPQRDQVELRAVDLESLLVADHPARTVWAFVQSMDLAPLYARIKSVSGRAGAPAIDPAILVALWLWATVDGVGSAREVDRLCERDDAYRWICGGVGVNYHSLAHFRTEHAAWLDAQLTRSIASLLDRRLVTLNVVAQDGLRVRAHAKASSFRRRDKLAQLHAQAQAQVSALKRELAQDAGASTRRKQAAVERAAREREQRLAAALATMDKLQRKPLAERKAPKPSRRRGRSDDGPGDAGGAPSKPEPEPRVSTTDADARVMKMAGKDIAIVSFGTDAPSEADCFGLTEEHGMRWLMLAVGTDEEGEKKRRGKAKVEAELFMNRLMPADALKIRGLHNATNVLAALALCRAIDLPLAPLLHAARQYKGEPHRVESVTTIAGVEYVDDSKGTNVGATIAALEGLGGLSSADEPRLILIAGGDGKGQDFTPLAGAVKRHAKAVMLIGRDGPAIREALANTGVSLTDCWTLEQAVERAAEIAKEGDIVLLSPACASFDMFTNYAHRAEVFVNAVREIGLARGEVSA